MEESYLPFALKYSNYTKFTQQTVKEFTPLEELCVYSIDSGKNRMHSRMTLNLCYYTYFFKMVETILRHNKDFTPDFMAGKSKMPPIDLTVLKFLNNPPVQKYLGVRKSHYLPFNSTFFNDFGPGDLFVDMKPYITRLLDDGVKGVIAVGALDFLTNYAMSEKVTSDLKWKWQKEYNADSRDDCKYGLCKEYKNLWEIRVAGSGHGTSFYKPVMALEIITRLVNWKPE